MPRGGLRVGAGRKPTKPKTEIEKKEDEKENFESWIVRKYPKKWDEFNVWGKGLGRLITGKSGLMQGSKEIVGFVIEYWGEVG